MKNRTDYENACAERNSVNAIVRDSVLQYLENERAQLGDV